jgi:ABC-type bacteriocin/lantibiotic exporter with double-glycine peptidase domain
VVKNIFEVLTYKERKKLTVVLFFVFTSAIMELFGLLSVLPFLAVMGKPSLIKSNYYLNETFSYIELYRKITEIEFLSLLGLISLAVILFSGLLRISSQFLINKFIELRRHSLEMRILNIYLKEDYEFFVLNHSQNLSKTILSEVDQFITQVLRPTLNLVAYGFILIILIITLLYFNPLLAVLSFCFLGGISFLLTSIMKKLSLRIGAIRTKENEKRYFYSGEIFNAIKEIKFSNTQSYYFNRFNDSSLKFSGSQFKYMFYLQIPNIVIETSLFSGMLIASLVFFYSQNKFSNDFLGEILPTIGFFGLAVLRLKPATIAVYNGIISLTYSKNLIDSIRKTLSLENKNNVSTNDIIEFTKSIDLKDISFKYRGTDNFVLSNINLSIKKGISIGIIGPSGSGKSTLLDILMGLLIPTSGKILVDNKILTLDNISSWQSKIGYVPQLVHLIDDTIIKNIAFGISESEINLNRVIQCCEIVQLSKFISDSMPKGYMSVVGERGVQLSGGQKQRIGIARALYHNPEIIIFDEASSALDGETEAAVMSAIDELSKSKTLIVVAHRLSTVKNCNVIIDLEYGRVKAIGTPNEILV